MDEFNTMPKTALQQDFENKNNQTKSFIQQSRDRYNINVSPEEYEQLNELTKLTGDPYKTATAYTYSKELGIDFGDAWQQLDELNSVFVGPKFKEKSPESAFTTVKDHFFVGMNTTKMGELGNKLMEAQLTGNTELEKATLEAYKALVEDNEALLNQNKEFWGDDLFNSAAVSAPFTFTGMGLAAIPYIGPALSFAYSSNQMTGLEYMNMVSHGIKPETARKIAPVAGILEGVVEVSLGNIAGTIGAKFGEKAAGEFLRKNVVNKVTTQVAKKLHYNGAFIKLGELAMRNTMENLEEGSEEFVQEVISLVSGAVANSIDGNGHSMTASEIAEDLWENAKGGFLGSILLSSPNLMLNAKASFKDYKTLKQDAETITSKEAFIKKAGNNKVFDGISDEIKNQTLNDIWERNSTKREESFRKQEEDIAEVYTAEDYIEAVEKEEDEQGNVISETVPEIYRTEKGNLFTETNKISEDHYKFQAGNGSKNNGKNYGYIDYTINDEDGTVTINNFKMAEHRESLRNELFIEFAKEVEGYDIIWNPKGKLAQNIKDTLININPKGKESGLNFFTESDANAKEDINTRIGIAREFAEKSNLNQQQQKSIIALMETAAKRMGKNITEYKNETFGDRILANNDEKNTVENALSDKVRGDIDFIEKGMTQDKAKKLNLRSDQVDVVNNALANLDDETKQALTEYALEKGRKRNNLSDEQKALAEKALSENPELKKVFDYATGLTSKSAKGAQLQRDTVNGMRAVIYAAENADFSTFVHELAHVWRKQIDGDLLAKVEKAFKIEDHNWTREDEENFARSFEQYLMTGKAKNSALKEIFEQLAQFMIDIYKTLKNLESQGGIKINDEIAKVFDDLLGTDGSALNLAEQAVNVVAQEKELEETRKENEKRTIQNESTASEENEKVYTKVDNTTSEAVDSIVNDNTLTEETKTQAIANASGDELKRQALLDFIEKNYSPDEFMQMKNWDQQTLLDFEQRIRNKESLYNMMPLFQLIGPKGAIALDVIENRNYNTSRLKQKDIAQQMKAAGKSADEIRRATGWEENTELGGIWTELTDGELKKDSGLYNNVNNILKAVNIIENSKNLDAITAANIAFKNQLELMNGKTVADYYDAKELFNAYPELKAIPLTFIHQVTPIKATLTPNGIAINLNYITDLAQVRSSLVHELQHVIQTIETNDIDSFKGMLSQNEMGWNELNSFLKNKLGNNYQINNLANVMQALSEYVQTDDYLAYYNQPMEVQARTAQKRADMNEFQKKNTSFADTDVLFQITDLTDAFPDGIETSKDLIDFLTNIAEENKTYTTEDNKEIGIEDDKNKIRHLAFGKKTGESDRRIRDNRDKYLNAIEQIINNAKEIKEPKENIKKDRKPDVAKYHYFRSYVKIGNKYFELRLDTEEKKGKKIGALPAPTFNSEKSIVNGKLNSPQNNTPDADNIAQNDEMSIPLYLYDIFETKMKMPNPENYIKNKEYREAVNENNSEKINELLKKEASAKGYEVQKYFGDGSWAAPTAVVEKEDFTNLEALQEYIDDYGGEVNIYGIINGIQGHDEDFYFNPTRAGFHGQAASDTAQVYRKLKYNNAGPDTKVTVYRAVPNEVQGEKLLSGDWIALSKAYCEEHGSNRYGEGNYHIIEQEVAIKDIWQGEEDMREFGYDDGNKDVEKNIKNNRKLLEVTVDENGYLIPLSERFNENNPSILYQLIGEKGAAELDKAEDKTERIDNLNVAQQMEESGKDAKTIRLATGWEKGADGKWKYEIPDLKVFSIDDYLKQTNEVVKEAQKYLENTVDSLMEFQDEKGGSPNRGRTNKGVIYSEEDLKTWETLNDMRQKAEIMLDEHIQNELNNENLTLRKLLNNTELLKAYPELKDIKIEFKKLSKEGGLYNSEDNKIIINKLVDKINQPSILLHEIQHAIQKIEGFAKGGSPESLAANKYNSLIDELAPIYAEIGSNDALIKKINDYKKASLELNFDSEDILEQMQRVEAIKDNDEKLSELWDKLQEISRKYNLIYKLEIDPLFDFRITDIDSPNAREALWRVRRLFNERSIEDYRNLAGEVESRNVQSRMNLTPEQRRTQLLEETEDIARDNQIVLFQEINNLKQEGFKELTEDEITEIFNGNEEIWNKSEGYDKHNTDLFNKLLSENKGIMLYLNEDDRFYTVSKNVKDNSGEWQLTYWDKQGPWGHKTFDDPSNALEELTRQVNLNDLHAKNEKDEVLFQAEKNNYDKKNFIEFGTGIFGKEYLQQSDNPMEATLFLLNQKSGFVRNVFKATKFGNVGLVYGDEDKGLYHIIVKHIIDLDDFNSIEDAINIMQSILKDGIEQPLNDKDKKTIAKGGSVNRVIEKDGYRLIIGKNPNGDFIVSTFDYTRKETQKERTEESTTRFDRDAFIKNGTLVSITSDNKNISQLNEKSTVKDNIFLQTEQDLRQSAMSFDNWMDFMDFYESALFLEEDEKDAIPKDANASWYQNYWEMVHGINPTTQQQEEEEQRQYMNNERTDEDPVTKDSIFNHELKFKKGMLEDFLRQINYVMDANLSQYEPEEGQIVSEVRDRINRLKNRAVVSNALRVANGKPLTDKMRKGILTAMRNATRDYRGIYAILMNDPRFKVAENETGVQELQNRADEVHLEVDMSLLSPTERARIADEIKEKEIAKQIIDGSFTFGDDAEFYIKRLNTQIEAKKQEIETLTKERDFDFKNLEDAMVRDLLKKYGEMLALKDELEFKKINVPSKLNKQIETAAKYNKDRSGLKAKYESIYKAYKDAEKSVEVTAEIREKLNKIENLQNVKAEYRELKKTERAMADLKELRKKLIKRTMRSVKFTNVDYESGKALIAIQRIFDPNLAQGINNWIGKEEVNAREIWSDWRTGTEEEKHSMAQFMQKSSRGIELMSVIENAKTQEDFNRISDKDKKSLERLFSKTDWIKELRLKQLRGEREGSIQLDIHEEERVYGTGEMDRNGNERLSSDIVAVYSDEVAELIEKYFPQDMIEKITSKPFQYWSIGEMEELAQQFNEVYKDGRNKLNAKKMREQADAYRLREMIESQIKDTGIVINPDDPEDVKKKKQEKINKILGINDTIRGTQADKQKRHSKINAILHGYQDANIRRVARILDGYNEGTCTNLLYWRENDCYNRKERSKDRRYDKITKVMTENNIKIEDLYKQIEIDISPDITQNFSIDEILFFAQAYMNNEEFLKQQKNEGIAKKDIKEESAFQALCYGNLMSSAEKEQYLNEDRAAIEKEKQRLDELELARIQGNKELEEELKKVSLTTHDINGNLILPGEEKVRAICKGRYDAIMEAYKNIDPKFKKLQEAIAEDYSKEFERINKASIEEFNAPVWREQWYLPLIRLDGIGDTHESRVKADLLGVSSGTGAAGTEKGFTVKRIRINPINQTAVETGLYKTWADSVERTEHFIAYASYIRQLNRVFLNKDASPLKQKIEGRYGNGMIKYIDSYIHEVANPNNGEPVKDFDKIVRMLRGNTAPAYLAWKASSILKQALSSPAPYAQFISPIEYTKAAIKLCNTETRRAIEAKSEFMKNRSFDPIVDIIAEQQMKATNPVTHALKKFQTAGMQGLEWIDYVCVAPGWLAIYEKEYNKLQADAETKYKQRVAELTEQNEAKSFVDRLSKKEIEAQAQEEVDDDIEMQAINKADDCVRLAQPSNRKVDLAPMFKNGSEVQKALLQFQTALNVIWQNIRYDIPYAAKNGEYKQIVGMTMGYMAAGIAMGMLTEGSDPDDEAQETLKKYIYYSLTQFTDAVPVVGSATTNLAEKIVTGKSGYTSTTDVFPTFTKMTQGAKALSDADFKKAAEKFAEGLALSAGLPYSGTKEALRVFGIGDGDGEADFYPEALMGRRQ